MHSALEAIDEVVPMGIEGTVSGVIGLTLQAHQFPVPLGAVCRVIRQGKSPLDVEVVGFRDEATILVAYGDLRGVRRGDRVQLVSSSPHILVGPGMLGRVLNGIGEVYDGGPEIARSTRVALYADPPGPMERPKIEEYLATGIRAIDALFTCAKGQRLGIFSGSGVGKSTLLGMMARFSKADVIVLGLVGERGREVREFLDKDLGPEGLRRSVVVCATGNESALMRVKCAFTATAVAEYFRDQGNDVLLLMDSLTRLAMSQREIGLSAGEPPTTKGYPPSIFSLMPKLLERAGLSKKGSITGFYTVLVEADDITEIVSDTVRGILDGHVWLSRRLANLSHYPSIDVLESISRSMVDVVGADHFEDSMHVKRIMATYSENEDLITVGAYNRGSSPLIDLAIRMQKPINQFLRQPMEEFASFEDSRRLLGELRKVIQMPPVAPPQQMTQPPPQVQQKPAPTMPGPPGPLS